MTNIIDTILTVITYGPLLWFFLKIIDIILDITIHFLLFDYLWNNIKYGVKILKTYFDPIKSEFIFSVSFDEQLDKEEYIVNIKQLFNKKIKEYKNLLEISNISDWNNNQHKLSIIYHNFNIEVSVRAKLDILKRDIVEGFNISLKTRYNFGKFKNYIDVMNSILQIIEKSIKEIFIIKNIGTGNIIIEPLKHNFNVDRWIKKDKFEVDTTLHNKERNIMIEIHPKKANIIVPFRIINPNIIKYYKRIIIHYYL